MAQLDTATLPTLTPQDQNIIAAGGRAPYVARYTTPYVSLAGGNQSSPQPGMLDAGTRRLVGMALLPGQLANTAAATGLPQQPAPFEPPAAPAPPVATLPSMAAAPSHAAPGYAPEPSNFQKAQNFAYALGDTRPEVLNSRFKIAYEGLNAETAAKAQELQAQTGKGQQLMTPHEIGQRQEVDPLTGMATRNENVFGTYNPETKTWEPIQLPTIEKKVEPSPNHVNALRANPALAAQFDAQYGVGAAKKALGQ